MSQENVELLLRAIEAWNRNDLAEWAEGLHEDVTWVPLAENTQTEPVHGVDATLAFVRDWIEPWDEYTVEVLEIVDASDSVFMSTRQSGKHPTGAEISIEMHAVATFQDDKLAEMRWFTQRAEALETAGLSE